jgi:LysR family transcriptional regulator, transcriptional activator of the cysJI operon
MEDHRLKSYCLVVETKSFSRAAQAKHMTQSAMSRLIKNLESELGVTLFHRKGKAAVPTSEGKLFYAHAKKILEEYSRMEQNISAASHAVKSTLRLGASKTPAVYLLPQVIYEFSKAHPDSRIDLSVCETATVVRDLRDGRIDVGIIDGIVGDQAITADSIAEDEIVVIASENHPLTKKKNVTLEELTAEPFILPDRESGMREVIEAFFREAGIDEKHIKVRMVLGSPDIIVRMVRAGLGIAFTSKWAAFTEVKEGTVKLLKIPGKKMKRHFFLIGIEKGAVSTAVSTFRDFIKTHRFFIPF